MYTFVNKKKWFTLIELMVVFTIASILLIIAYTPYSYYSTKAKVRMTTKDISQILYESRNLAIHGLDNWSWNLNVGVYFDNSEWSKNKIKVYSYPHDFLNIVPDEGVADINVIKTLTLKPGMQIDKISWKDNALFVFTSISGTWSYFYFSGWKNNFLDDEIKIEFSYKWSTNLNSSINYITKTNIVDY